MEKLKTVDMKLLAYLYQHNRESLSKIAKAIGLSREQVDYRIKQYEKYGLIKGYIPVVNYAKLEYNNLVMVLVELTKPIYLQEIKKSLKSNKNRITTVEAFGKYNLTMVFVFRNEREKNEYILQFLEQNKDKISDHLIIEPYYLKSYPLKFIGNKRENDYLWIDYQKTPAILDEKDEKILALLNKNARMRVIDIAKKTNLSAELIVYKIKKLKNEGVLLGSRTILDMQKLGYFYTMLQITVKNLSQKLGEQLSDFAKNSLHIETFYLSINKPNCYMQLFHKTPSELYETIEDLKEKFSEESFTIEILPLKNEGEDINALPFL